MQLEPAVRNRDARGASDVWGPAGEPGHSVNACKVSGRGCAHHSCAIAYRAMISSWGRINAWLWARDCGICACYAIWDLTLSAFDACMALYSPSMNTFFAAGYRIWLTGERTWHVQVASFRVLVFDQHAAWIPKLFISVVGWLLHPDRTARRSALRSRLVRRSSDCGLPVLRSCSVAQWSHVRLTATAIHIVAEGEDHGIAHRHARNMQEALRWQEDDRERSAWR